ncbi:MAG: hypothetical protein LQ352_006373 [Teloschistes flavicans]|nr:MAG: hypothetical protein LQ352_006373 [Teloschistes flavicans]
MSQTGHSARRSGLQGEQDTELQEQSFPSSSLEPAPRKSIARQSPQHADPNDDDGNNEAVVNPSRSSRRGHLTLAPSEVSSVSSWSPLEEDSDEISESESDEDATQGPPSAAKSMGKPTQDDSDDDVSIDGTTADGSRGKHDKKNLLKTRPTRFAEKHPDAPKESNLKLKIREAESRGLSVNERGIQMGTIRGEGKTLEYFHNGDWIPAIFHEDLREYLLRYTDRLGEYDETPDAGYDVLDRTAFHADAQSWRLGARDQRPDVLFLWDPPDSIGQSYQPELWYHHNRIVLSSEKLPVKKWRELPLTISGQCEGLRIEAWRRQQPDLTMRDLCARMPRTTCKGEGKVQQVVKGNALANRVARDRSRIGIKPWFERLGSKKKTYRLLEIMPEAVQLRILQSNSTECWRDLTDTELAYVEEGNKGSEESLKKAGARRVSNAAREERLKQVEERAKRKGKVSAVKLHTVIEGAIQKPSMNRYGPMRGTRRGAPINVSTVDDSEALDLLGLPQNAPRTRRRASPAETEERRAMIRRHGGGLSLDSEAGYSSASGLQAGQTNAEIPAPSPQRPNLRFGEHNIEQGQSFDDWEPFPAYSQHTSFDQQPSSSAHQPRNYDLFEDLEDIQPAHSTFADQSYSTLQDLWSPPSDERPTFHTAYGQASNAFEEEASTPANHSQLPREDECIEYPLVRGLIDWDQYKAVGWRHMTRKPGRG